MIDASTFSKTAWLTRAFQPYAGAQVMGPVEELGPLLQRDPGAFFAPPYQRPYEDWCVADHEAARMVDAAMMEQAARVARTAYLAAWEVIPYPEFCGLICDDVETIYCLLSMRHPLRSFTMERIQWYVEGRAPWGYTGEFPHGRWLII